MTTSDWNAAGASQLSLRMRELEDGLDAVAGRIPQIVDAIGRLDSDIDRLVAEHGGADEAIARHEAQLAELTSTVRRLSAQIAWIEQHIRSSGTARTADLDHLDPDLVVLAATSESGREVRAELLSPAVRGALEAEVSQYAAAVDRRVRAARGVLASAARVAAAERGDAAFRKARSAYLAARDELAEADRVVTAGADEAAQAVGRLAEDDDRARREEGVLLAADRAERELLTRLRTRIAAAVGEGALLPEWLTTPIGHRPPPGATERWLDVAAGLLAYRLTYAVDDLQDALGVLDDDVPAHRRRWYADLGRGVRDLRR